MTKVFDLRVSRLEKRFSHREENYDFSNVLLDEIWLAKLLEFEETLARGDAVTATWGEDAAEGRQMILDQFKLTVELRSGQREYQMPGDTYAASIARAAARWTELDGKDPYVPALSHLSDGRDWPEYDGFDCGKIFPDLMQRRSALWAHPRVREILRA